MRLLPLEANELQPKNDQIFTIPTLALRRLPFTSHIIEITSPLPSSSSSSFTKLDFYRQLVTKEPKLEGCPKTNNDEKHRLVKNKKDIPVRVSNHESA
jgi:hypothetical protein